jgi:hypothetical protein
MPRSIKIEVPPPEVKIYEDPVTVPAAPKNLIFIIKSIQHLLY